MTISNGARSVFAQLGAVTAAIFLGSPIASAGPPYDTVPGDLDPEAGTEETRIVEIQGGGLMFLDAHETAARDYNVVLRQYQGNDGQRWLLTDMGGGVYTIMQMNTGRYLDAHEIPELDYRVVTRPRQTFDNTQLWYIQEYGGGFVTIQHYNTGLFLEPYLDPAHDFQVVLRPERPGDNLQVWRM
jgi:hypothetical protein